MKLVLKIAIGVVLAVIVLIAGCTALLGGAANEVAKELDKEAQKGITAKQFRSVKQGTTRAAVEAKLGEPEDVQEMEIDTSDLAEITGGEDTQQHDCIYYSRKGELASLYQFCFDDGKLTSKSSY